jgi:hypothetical protein
MKDFSKGLYFVASVRWKTNYENSALFVPLHSLLLIPSVAVFILQGPIFSFQPSVILYNPEGIIHKVLTS